jgi:hypothetical protein
LNCPGVVVSLLKRSGFDFDVKIFGSNKIKFKAFFMAFALVRQAQLL